MKVSQAFPSGFLKADDLQSKAVTVTIESVDLEEIGQGRDKSEKLLIAFRGKEKKLVCNKTNAGTIAKLYGDDTDGWIGQKITLVPREVEFSGDMVWAIRVSLQKPGQMTSQPAPKVIEPEPEPQPDVPSDDGSEIPF